MLPSPADLGARPVPELAGLEPGTVLRGLVAEPGLVVLSGTWLGGGVVIARDPVRTADGADLAEVFAGCSAGEGAGRLGGGWFGWLGYPGSGATPSGHFGWHPNVVRWDRRTRTWWDEAVPDPGLAADVLEGRRRALRDVLGRAATAPAPLYALGELSPDTTRGGYAAAVERCIEHIRAGDVYQANICLQLAAPFRGDPAAAFADLVAALRPAYAALVCGPDRTVVSASPELFLRRIGAELTSSPIKGTRPRAGPAARDRNAIRLRESAKERAENVMIVDLVRNDLARVAQPGSVRVPRLLSVEPHCGVWHLVSTVTARLRTDRTDADLLAAAFPPGSVTGAPKSSARRIIDDLETGPRGAYTGAVGFVSPRAGLELNVAIRTLEIAHGRARLGVGAGITAGSEPDAEWLECLAKAAPLAAVLDTEVAADHAVVPAPPGSGVFETMLVLAGAPVDLDAHLERLARSADELWDAPLPATLRDDVRAAAAAAGHSRLRLDLNRTDGRLAATLRVAPAPEPVLPADAPGLDLPHVALFEPLGRHKWSDRTRIDAWEQAHGRRQVLLVDGASGQCLETTRGNVLAVFGERVVTPPLDGRILPGVTRRRVLEHARDRGLAVELRPVRLRELAAADGLMVTGSVAGLLWVRRCAGVSWPGPTAVMTELAADLLARWLSAAQVPRSSPLGC